MAKEHLKVHLGVLPISGIESLSIIVNGTYPLNKVYPGGIHCVKGVRIRSYSGLYFPTFRLVRMQEKADQNNSKYGHFSRSDKFSSKNKINKLHGSSI